MSNPTTEAIDVLEATYVGGVILAPGETDHLTKPVAPEQFADFRLATVLSATLAVYHREPVLAGDVGAVVTELRARGELDRIGGAAAIYDLAGRGCIAASLAWYGERIINAFHLRQLAAASVRIQQAATTNPIPATSEDTDAIGRFAWEQLESALGGETDRNVLPMADVFDEWLVHTTTPAIPIGLPDLARECDIPGARLGHLMLIAARPATGKSTALAQAAVDAARHGHGVLYVTLEMTRREVLERCLANLTSTPLDRLREQHWSELPSELRSIRVVDAAMSVTDIAAAVRASRRSPHPIQMVLVDYLQLLTPPSGTGENRQTEVAAISRSLKRVAIEENIAVLAASQLNRASEARAERRPTLADLRESGQLEADSDAVILLHRDSDLPENLYLIVAKNRHGRIGEVSTLAMYERSTLASLSLPAQV